MTKYRLDGEFLKEIKNKNLEKVKELLPKINLRMIEVGDPYERENILTYSLEAEAKEIFAYLVSVIDVDFEYIDDDHGITGTTLTYTMDYIMNYIIGNEYDINITDINLLLLRTKDINKIILNGDTLLHRILRSFSIYRYEIVESNNYDLFIDTVKLCLDYGADPYIKNNTNESAFDCINLKYEYSVNLAKTLLNNKYNKPISISAFVRLVRLSGDYKYDIMELLLPHISDINEVDKYGHTLLWYAKEKGDSDMIELLEAHGALP